MGRASIRLKTATAVGTIDCALSLHYAFRRHLLRRLSARSIPLPVTNYLYGYVALRCQPNTYACYSFSAMLRKP
ncbi:MAG: hypothetical protein HDT05_05970 [Bacteroidales bacterium]|nr:hypothetical protein [Bacteroidales bacterium]